MSSALEDESILVLAMMPVHRRRQGVRLHRVLHECELLAHVLARNNKPGADTAQNREVAIL